MKRATRFDRIARHGLAITMLAVLAACGGGGGGGGGGGPALIDLTASNRDSVAHAAAVSVLPLSLSYAVPVLGGAGPLGVLWSATSGAFREHPMALVSQTVPCVVSGSATVTLDDHNGSGNLDVVGESATVVFNQCQNDAYYVMSGTSVLTATAVDSARFDMTQLSQNAVNGRHGMTVDGSVNMVCAQIGPTSARCTSTAAAPVRAIVHTHLYDDTVILEAGFVEEEISDTATGHLTTSPHGTVTSSAAGGSFSVSTDAAIARLGSEPYAHEGRLRITGERGTMLISPQSATQVKVELDPTDDGVFESSEVEDWDWLL